jgi:hypothetical protein
MQIGAKIPVSVVGAATSVGAIELLLAHLSNTLTQSLITHLTASFLRDVDDERQRDGLRPFEPP